MRRFIIGAVALVTGLLAAGGVALTTRRRRDRDEVLPLDAAPPLAAGEPEEIAHASVEADFGSTVAAAEAEAPVAPKRKRPRRKPAKATTEGAPATGEAPATDADAADTAATADPADAVTATEARPQAASADATTADPAPAESPGARTAEAAEIAAAAEAAELSGSPELPSAS